MLKPIVRTLLLSTSLACLTACDIELPSGLISDGGSSPTVTTYNTKLPDKILTQKESIDLARVNANRFQVELPMVMGVITQESAFNANAVSHAGALGLMQLMPGTIEHINNVSPININSPFNPSQNVAGGTWYLRSLYNQLSGFPEQERWKFALGSYNGGIGRVTRYIKEVAQSKPREDVTWDDIKYKMPSETRNYVPSVLRHTAYYKARLD